MSGCSDKSLSSINNRLLDSQIKHHTRHVRFPYSSGDKINKLTSMCNVNNTPINNLDCPTNCRPQKQATTNLSRDVNNRYYSSKSEYLKKQFQSYKSCDTYSKVLNNETYHKQGAATASEKIQKLKFETNHKHKRINNN